jgi:hypothetical protein
MSRSLATEELAIVLRYVEWADVEPADRIEVKALFSSPAMAAAEARRLNALPKRGPSRIWYFVKVFAATTSDSP